VSGSSSQQREGEHEKHFYRFAICALFVAYSFPAEAQETGKVHRFGFLIAASNLIALYAAAFWQALRALGYTEGKNVILEVRGVRSIPIDFLIWR